MISRIFVGTVVDYDKIIQILHELKQELHLNGIVEGY